MGELVIANSGFFKLYEEMRKISEEKSIINEFKSRMEQMSRIAKDLQSGIMKTRMVPIGQVFSRFKRLVRDLAKEFGKDVELTIKTTYDPGKRPRRFRWEIASDLGIRRQRVRGFMLGEHGNGMVPIWSSVRVQGMTENEWRLVEPVSTGQEPTMPAPAPTRFTIGMELQPFTVELQLAGATIHHLVDSTEFLNDELCLKLARTTYRLQLPAVWAQVNCEEAR